MDLLGPGCRITVLKLRSNKTEYNQTEVVEGDKVPHPRLEGRANYLIFRATTVKSHSHYHIEVHRVLPAFLGLDAVAHGFRRLSSVFGSKNRA